MERDNHVHWIGSVSIVKMSVLSKLIHTGVQCNRSKYLNRAVAAAAAVFFHLDRLVLKFIWKGTGPRMAKAILRKSWKTYTNIYQH